MSKHKLWKYLDRLEKLDIKFKIFYDSENKNADIVVCHSEKFDELEELLFEDYDD